MFELGFEPAKYKVPDLVILRVWNCYDELLSDSCCESSGADYLERSHDGIWVFDRHYERSMIYSRSVLVYCKVGAEFYSGRDDVSFVSKVLVYLIGLSESTIRSLRFLQQD